MRRYLSQIFLNIVDEECSDKSVIKAVKKCSQVLEEETGDIKTKQQLIDYYFTKEEDRLIGNSHWKELRDLWDVFSEFYVNSNTIREDKNARNLSALVLELEVIAADAERSV